MENRLTVNFEAPPEHILKWEALSRGLKKGELGAFMEERIEPFGPLALAKLDEMFDEYPMENFMAYSWSSKHQRFKLVFILGVDVHEFSSDLKGLLKLCDAREINLSLEIDDE